MTMSDKQLRYIMNALEEHFRLRMGQALIGGLTDDLCFQSVDLDGADRKQKFDEAIDRRDRGLEKLQEYMNICFEDGWKRKQKTKEVIDEIDMWHVIRHFFWEQRPADKRPRWVVDADPVYLFGDEPMLRITIVEEKSK